MVEQKIVRMADVDQLAIVAGERLQAVVGRLDEDLRLVSLGAQDALNPEDFVSDGIAVSERGQDLVDLNHRDWPPLRRDRLYPRR